MKKTGFFQRMKLILLALEFELAISAILIQGFSVKCLEKKNNFECINYS